MKKKLLLAILLLSGTFFAHGQSTVWEMPTLSYDTTIVRHWQGEEDIIYTSNGSRPGTVSYHDNASGNTISISLPPNVVIRDFRIAHDSVFAGGSYNNNGLLACFNINDMLSGAANISHLIIPAGSMDQIDCYLFPYGHYVAITGVERIALYEYDHATRIAYIADCKIYHNTDPTYILFRSVGYGDAAFLANSNQWDICDFNYNKDAIEVYTDICTTDNKIVIAARSEETPYKHLLRFQVFDKVRNFAQAPPSLFSDRFGFPDHFVLGKVMVTHLKMDHVAVAYHYSDRSNGGLAVKAIDVGSPVPTLINSLEIPEDTTTNIDWYMNDIRYAYPFDVLLVLNRIHHPSNGIGSYIYQIRSPYGFGTPCRATTCPAMKEIHSLDNFEADRFVASGKNYTTNPEVFIETFYNDNTCGTFDDFNSIGTSPSPLPNRPRHHCTIWNPPIMPTTTPPFSIPAFPEPIQLYCNKPY